MTTVQELYIEGHKLVALRLDASTSGTPVILFHGITASVYFWTPDLVAPFKKLGPCYALSLPGHYPASFPENFSQKALTAETIARILASAIHQLVGEQPVILVGHSTGGFSVLDIAIYAPDMPRSVISISGFTHGRWTGFLGIYQWLARKGPAGQALFKAIFRLGHMRAVYRGVSRFYAADARNLNAYPYFDTAIEQSHPYFRKLSFDAMVQYFTVMPDIDITAQLNRLSVPTLVLTGDEDPIVPPAQSRLIARQVASADLGIVKKAGHFPFYENPTGYQTALESWLEQHEQKG